MRKTSIGSLGPIVQWQCFFFDQGSGQSGMGSFGLISKALIRPPERQRSNANAAAARTWFLPYMDLHEYVFPKWKWDSPNYAITTAHSVAWWYHSGRSVSFMSLMTRALRHKLCAKVLRARELLESQEFQGQSKRNPPKAPPRCLVNRAVQIRDPYNKEETKDRFGSLEIHEFSRLFVFVFWGRTKKSKAQARKCPYSVSWMTWWSQRSSWRQSCTQACAPTRSRQFTA